MNVRPEWKLVDGELVPPPCEVCGAPAICFIHDYETWPDENTMVRVAGLIPNGIHYFCQEHQREPVEYRLDAP